MHALTALISVLSYLISDLGGCAEYYLDVAQHCSSARFLHNQVSESSASLKRKKFSVRRGQLSGDVMLDRFKGFRPFQPGAHISTTDPLQATEFAWAWPRHRCIQF